MFPTNQVLSETFGDFPYYSRETESCLGMSSLAGPAAVRVRPMLRVDAKCGLAWFANSNESGEVGSAPQRLAAT